jgi:hypothetical protein
MRIGRILRAFRCPVLGHSWRFECSATLRRCDCCSRREFFVSDQWSRFLCVGLLVGFGFLGGGCQTAPIPAREPHFRFLKVQDASPANIAAINAGLVEIWKAEQEIAAAQAKEAVPAK